MCAFDPGFFCPPPSRVLFAQRGQILKLKQLPNSRFISFHNMRGLREGSQDEEAGWPGRNVMLPAERIHSRVSLQLNKCSDDRELSHRYVSIFAVAMLICNDYLQKARRVTKRPAAANWFTTRATFPVSDFCSYQRPSAKTDSGAALDSWHYI